MSAPLKSASKGRFQIYDPIGAGAVATVYQAYDRARNEMCALKLMNEESSNSEKRRKRFLSEASALESLKHPHIVPVRAVGEDKGRLWIAMELMGGGSAGRALKKGGPMRASRALDIIYKVLLGLEEAHQAGIVHRDVKPQNILLGDDNAVKLCDFGIARQEKPADDAMESTDGLTKMFDRLGSIIYMAPEQRADPRDVDRGTDIYASGATLFALVTGRRPPDLSRAPVRPKMLDVVPAPLRPLVLKATDLDRTRRYQTAAEMAAEAKRLRDDARKRPEWYERPARQRTRERSEDFAQWPERQTPTPAASIPPQDEGTPGVPPISTPTPTPPPAPREAVPPPAPTFQRRESYRPGAPSTTPAPVPRSTPTPPRRIGSVAPPPSTPLWERVPLVVWLLLAGAAALALFVVGIAAGALAIHFWA